MHPFDMAEALASQPLPKGKRVAIISGGGGHCVATADFCAQLGLEVPVFDRETQLSLKGELAPHAPIPKNPIDLAGGIRSPMAIANLAEKVARLDYIDGIITTPPMGGGGRIPRGSGGGSASQTVDPADSPFPDLGPLTPTSLAKIFLDAAEGIATIPERFNKPVIISQVRAVPGGASLDVIGAAGIPAYGTPEESARAMYALCRYAEVRRELEAI
jgi:acyl-CoA synthetase (NDP forming)